MADRSIASRALRRSIYLQGIDIEEIISTVHAHRAPMMSATACLRL